MEALLANHFYAFVAIGFVAQLIGSLLGMGFGVVSSASLLSMGMGPVLASATANAASFITTTVASWFHYKEGNVERKTLLCLAVPGVAGAVAGAAFIKYMPVGLVKVCTAIYLLVVSVVILVRFVKKRDHENVSASRLIPLGFFGGIIGAMVGGGWGPVVNGNLIANGHSPRYAIGSSNAAKSFVTFAAAATLAVTLKSCNFWAIGGLLLGGLFASPLAAAACKRAPSRALMVSAALLLVLLSARIFKNATEHTSGPMLSEPQLHGLTRSF